MDGPTRRGRLEGVWFVREGGSRNARLARVLSRPRGCKAQRQTVVKNSAQPAQASSSSHHRRAIYLEQGTR